MKKQPTGNKASRFAQEDYLKQQSRKDIERKALVSAMYKEGVPKKRYGSIKKGKST